MSSQFARFFLVLNPFDILLARFRLATTGNAHCRLIPRSIRLIQARSRWLHRDVDRFDGWLARTQDSRSSELRRFASGLTTDLSTVRDAFQSPWSSGQVEGQINRLQFLKRQMYGRAKLDLLRPRVLHPN